MKEERLDESADALVKRIMIEQIFPIMEGIPEGKYSGVNIMMNVLCCSVARIISSFPKELHGYAMILMERSIRENVEACQREMEASR